MDVNAFLTQAREYEDSSSMGDSVPPGEVADDETTGERQVA
jgi:hypothetical protein